MKKEKKNEAFSFAKPDEIKCMNPTYIDESSDGRRELPIKPKLMAEGTFFLDGEVTDEMANDFVAEMLYQKGKGNEVNIFINSPGGSVNAGLVIYDVVQACKGKIPINMYCTGTAASMAAVILAGGQKGRRYILPHSKCMIHEPLIQRGMGGSATSIKKTADSILETKAITNGILAKHTGKSIEEIDEATSFDNFMNAEEAVEFGICDKIKNIF